MHIETYNLLYSLTGMFVFVCLVVGYLLYSMTRLHHQFILVTEKQNHERIRRNDNEQLLIGADLHDDIAMSIVGIIWNLGLINPVTEKEQKLLDKSLGYLRDINEKIKKIASGFFPQYLVTTGPLPAIEEFCRDFLYDVDLKIEVIGAPGKELGEEKSLQAYHMLQEIIQNTIRHSKAKSLTIYGKKEEDRMIISTWDDGVGFIYDPYSASRGKGLQTLKLRARIMGAKLEMKTAPGRGAWYTIEIPFN